MQREISLELVLHDESFCIAVPGGLLILKMILFIREVPLGNGRGKIPRTLSLYLVPGDGPEDKRGGGTSPFRQHDNLVTLRGGRTLCSCCCQAALLIALQ